MGRLIKSPSLDVLTHGTMGYLMEVAPLATCQRRSLPCSEKNPGDPGQ